MVNITESGIEVLGDFSRMYGLSGKGLEAIVDLHETTKYQVQRRGRDLSTSPAIISRLKNKSRCLLLDIGRETNLTWLQKLAG